MNNISLKISQKFYLKDRKVFINNMSMNSMHSDMMSNSMNMNTMSDSMDMGMMSMMNGDKDPIMIMAKWMPNMKTMFMASGSYSDQMKKFPIAGLTINHMFDKGKVGYAKRYTRMTGDFNQTLDYSEFFANLQIKDNVSFVAEVKRDDENSSNIESSVGIGFENCCFSFRILASDKNLSKYLDGYRPEAYQYLGDAWDDIIRIESKSRINFEFELKGLNSSFEKVSRFMNNSLLSH
jgi:lipopolysaccharide assembly outer membrane protein LptD (OstA)